MKNSEIEKLNHNILKKFSNKRTCPKSFLTILKIYRDDLKVAYHHKMQRFVIAHVDKKTKLTRIIRVVEDQNGGFRDPDVRDIEHIRKHVMWDLLDSYPEPDDMWEAFDNAEERKKIMAAKKRQQWIQDFIKDRKTQWDEALEKFRSTGKSKDPYDKVNRLKDKKISVDFGGYAQRGALLVPTSINDKG
ncbi:MAG: hypothetical protein SFW66_08845 [Gammaproteobacteria bacterium]|nr:hypothetical protein [Gammaproteobacteria bacterium]